jgi:hypothetical protein
MDHSNPQIWKNKIHVVTSILLSDTHHLQSVHLSHEKETTLLQWYKLIVSGESFVHNKVHHGNFIVIIFVLQSYKLIVKKIIHPTESRRVID